ncbi:MAG TPA: carotenoid oxygenase family protein [Steroidobacteraceae bacterium]|nr:carotenoid oxygenase family protein [Steroidobacteraceae bacterium]
MHRRSFMQSALLASLAAAGRPGFLRAEVLAPTGPERFAAGLAREPWLAGWKSVAVESLGPTPATIEGNWPGSLTGTLYRNGPARFERGALRYRHWFDGDGMMQAWRFRDGRITHAGRMIATGKFMHEEKAGRFEVRAAGTTIPDAIPARNNDSMNTANTAVVKLGQRVFALWEGGSAYEIDPDTLAARGPTTWRSDLVAAPFSAHPLLERDGSAWNFGSLDFFGTTGLIIWRIGADGALARTAVLESQDLGYLHSFAMTEKYLVFTFMPYRMLPDKGSFFERLQFTPDRACRIALVPKDALDAPRWFEAPFAAIYHFADAYEHRGEVVVRAARHRDIEEARAPMAAAMLGERGTPSSNTELVSLRLSLASGRARWDTQGVSGLEFPTFDARTPGDRPALLFAPASVKPANAPFFNAISSIDTRADRVNVHHYGADVMAEEHLFVPRPGSSKPADGWLVGTLLDFGRGRSGVAVLDAARVQDGPLAIAWVPYTVPLGFHGWFAAG